MVGRSLPEALRRGLTFWRRSIQARVVVSTVLLSAVVVVAVGWFLLRQVEQGLVDHRVETVLHEVANENQAGHRPAPGRAGTDTDANDQAAGVLFAPIFASGQARGFSVVMAGPGAPDSSLEERGDEAHPAARPRQRPAVARRPLRRRRRAVETALDLHHHPVPQPRPR